MICFASCIEGLFFFAAFAYVYFCARGLLNGLATGTNWVFRDESGHELRFDVVRTVRREERDIFDQSMIDEIHQMLDEAIECELRFADDVLSGGIIGLNAKDMREYLQYVADQRLAMLDLEPRYGSKTPSPSWSSGCSSWPTSSSAVYLRIRPASLAK